VIKIHTPSHSHLRCFPAGDLDHRAAIGLRQVVGRVLRPGMDVVFDLRDVESMDATGVSALTDSFRLVRTLGGAARVCNTRRDLRWRLELVGLERPLVGSSVPDLCGAA
jgi:anti-anti-sigma factor